MLARVLTFALDGLDPRAVSVEVDVRAGLPSFTIVGLGDLAVRESRERVRSALANQGFTVPAKRITVNLAPASLRKVGPGFDLPIAVGILAAAGQVPPAALERTAVAGELGLGGELRSGRGALAVAEGSRAAGLDALLLPAADAPEAALVPDLGVRGARTLVDAVDVLRGGPGATASPRPTSDGPVEAPADLADVRGQRTARRALEIAAAGGHSLLLVGPPGTGKTMLARRLPGLLPPPSREVALEVTRIHSVCGLHDGTGLVARRPFRAPHHGTSARGLVGGGTPPTPGEVTLAHHGVLFLDELAEFRRDALEALRQPLEDGVVTIVRGGRAVAFPARTALVAATNPCPCGHHGTDRCRCLETDVARYRRRLSGPLLDRIDLLVPVGRPQAEELAAPPGEPTADVAARVEAAVRRRTSRAASGRSAAPPQPRALALVDAAYAGGRLSARGRARVLRVAGTVADLAGADAAAPEHVAEALQLRQDLDLELDGEASRVAA